MVGRLTSHEWWKASHLEFLFHPSNNQLLGGYMWAETTTLRYLLYIRGYTSYILIIIGHHKDPFETTSIIIECQPRVLNRCSWCFKTRKVDENTTREAKSSVHQNDKNGCHTSPKVGPRDLGLANMYRSWVMYFLTSCIFQPLWIWFCFALLMHKKLPLWTTFRVFSVIDLGFKVLRGRDEHASNSWLQLCSHMYFQSFSSAKLTWQWRTNHC